MLMYLLTSCAVYYWLTIGSDSAKYKSKPEFYWAMPWLPMAS